MAAAWPLIEPRADAAPDSIGAALANGDSRLAGIFPPAALTLESAPSGRRPASDSGRLELNAFRLTGDPARHKLEQILGGNGFLVSTGQQPGLFLGPLYGLYKALTAAELAGRLEQQWRVPVLPLFWVASDDHDWQEIGITRLLQRDEVVRTLRLDPPPSHARRSAGTAPLAGIVDAPMAEARTALEPLPFGELCMSLIEDAYQPDRTLGGAFVEALAAVLDHRPFAILDGGSSAVKRAGAPLLRRALAAAGEARAAVARGAATLESAGFPVPIPVLDGAAPVFFDTGTERVRLYLRDGSVALGRDGELQPAASVYEVLDTAPDRFSPNVSLRPVLESSLLPVAATVLGPSEIGYWAQLPPLFALFDVPMPLIRPRFGWTVIEPVVARLLEKLQAGSRDLDDGGRGLLERAVKAGRPLALDSALSAARAASEAAYEELAGVIAELLPGLKSAAGRARTEARKALDGLERNVDSELRQRQEVLRQQAERAAIHLFPEQTHQERFYNPLTYLARYGWDFIDSVEAAGRNASWPHGPHVAHAVVQE